MHKRHIGSAVADLQRNSLKGGIFIYPNTESAPRGKLRLLYEGNPMSFIVEQAGGLATTGEQRIMALQPTNLHQRCPVIMGSRNEVERIISYHLEAQ